MSIKLISAVFQHGPLEGIRRYVLVALADYADKDGVAWPSVTELVKKCRLGRMTVLRCLDDLERDGWISIERRDGLGNHYRLHLPPVPQRDGYEAHEPVPQRDGYQYQPETSTTVVPVPERYGTSTTVSTTSTTVVLANKERLSGTVINRHSSSASADAEESHHKKIRDYILEKFFDRYQRKCEWTGREGTVVKRLLRDNPSWGWRDWQGMIDNYFRSANTNGCRPAEWLPKISHWSKPLNEYGREEKPNGKATTLDAIRNSRTMPDFGSGAVQADEPVED